MGIPAALDLSGGVRHDSPKNFDSHNSFSYKLAWDITKKDSIYAGRSDYYILPSLSQLYDVKFGNKDLKASEGRTTSIGYNHEFGPENYLTFGWFETKVGVGLNIANDGTYHNVIGGIIRGWNAQYNVRLSRYVNAKLGWSHLYYDDSSNFSMAMPPKTKPLSVSTMTRINSEPLSMDFISSVIPPERRRASKAGQAINTQCATYP